MTGLMRKTILYIAFVPSLFLLSCNKATEDVTSRDAITLSVSLPATKVTASAFENGDALSLFAVERDGETQLPLQISGNFINNEKFTYDGSSWASSRTLYWSSSACDFYAIYPYQARITSIDNQAFDLVLDQSADGYEASDLMYASALNRSRGDGAVPLQFRHMMSKCKVVLVKGAEFEGDIPDDAVVHIYNTVTTAQIDFTKGSLQKAPMGERGTITMKKTDNTHFEAIVVPQFIESRTPLVEITMGGIAYLLEYSISFRPGYSQTLQITLNTSPDQEMIEINIDAGTEGWN